MFENGPIIPERPKETPEELRKKLTTIPDTPGALRKTLSKENVQRFMQILTSPTATETDWLVLCGDLTPDQADQYWSATGDYDTCANELTELAVKLADDLRPRLGAIVKSELNGQKNEGLDNLFRSLQNLYLARFEPLKKLRLGSEHIASGFMHQIMALVGSDLIDMMNDPKTDRNSASAIRAFLDRFGGAIHEATGITFGGIQFNNEKAAYREAFKNEEHLINLDQAFGVVSEYSEEDRQRISAENKEVLAFVKTEALYKKIPLVTLSDSGPQIIMMRDGSAPGESYSRLLPTVRINFQEGIQIGFPGFKKDKDGQLYCDYGINPNIVNFKIDPATGDLTFITSGLPLSQVVSTDRYLAMQNYVLRKLRDYLTSKDPDIEDLFAYSPTELNAQKERIEAAEKGADTPGDQAKELVVSEDVNSEDAQSESWQYIPATEEPSVASSVETTLVLPKHIRALVMNRISGARADDILAALRKMLGKEVRVEGSHHFFRSERTGVALPVPRHSQGSKREIALGLILNNLKTWQYSPTELAIELGAKIPEKIMKGLPS